MNIVGYDYQSSDDENADMCVAEWDWASKSKPFVCTALKPISHKKEEMKFTFDVSKCDRIFDYLLQHKQIKLSNGHVIPPPEELKRRAYCKYHDSYSHATNDCNVFRRQVQSAINEGRLKFDEKKMQLDDNPFPTNMVSFENKKVLIRPSQAESAKGKNVVVGENRLMPPQDDREVTKKLEASGSGGTQSSRPKMIKPKSPEVDRWKVNEVKSRAFNKVEKPKVTFDKLLAKYQNGRAGQKCFNRPNNFKRPRSSPRQKFNGPDYRHKGFQAAVPFPCNGPPPMPMPWGPPPVDFAPCPPWGWCGPWMPPPPMMPFGQFHPRWAAHRRPVFNRLSHPKHDRFEQRNWSSGRDQRKTVRKVYRVKESGNLNEESNSVATKNQPDTEGHGTTATQELIMNNNATTVANGKGDTVSSMSSESAMAKADSIIHCDKSGTATTSNSAMPGSSSEAHKVEGNKPILPGTQPQPRWCPKNLSHSQKRRLQRLRMNKLREDEAEKWRDEWFNEERPMIPVRKEWRAKSVATSSPILSDDEEDLLSNDGSPVIKNGSPSPDSMEINMVFTLPSEFRAMEESEAAQLCLGPKEATFEKPDESSRHLKPLYIKGHINGRPISRMLVDGGAAINFMPCSIFKKLG